MILLFCNFSFYLGLSVQIDVENIVNFAEEKMGLVSCTVEGLH